MTACGPGVPQDTVATYDGGSITSAEARRYLDRLDTRRLRTQAAVDAEQGLGELLAELAFLKILAAEGGDEEPAPAVLHLDARAASLVRYYVERKGKRSHQVSDEEAHAFYQEHLADRFTVPEKVKFQHVFLRADRHSPSELARLERTILDRLAGGTPFAELVAAYSESGSAKQDGVVGAVYRGRMDPSFEEQIYLLAPMRPGVIRTSQGVHVAVVLDKQPAKVEPFADMKRQIVSSIMDRRDEAERNQLLETLRARYSVEERSADATLGPDDVVLRVRDRSLTRRQLNAYLMGRLAAPVLMNRQGTDYRRQLVDELVTTDLLYLDAVDGGLDQEQGFLDRWALLELRRRSDMSRRRRLDAWAKEISDEEILHYYRENEARFAVPRRFQASYFFVPFGAARPFELQQRLEELESLAALPEADLSEIERRSAEAGAQFVDMGWITPADAARVGPEFQRRLLALAAPGSTGVFKGEAGLYLVLMRAVEARRPMTLPADMDLVRARFVDLQSHEILALIKQRLLEERHFTVRSTAVFEPADAQS